MERLFEIQALLLRQLTKTSIYQRAIFETFQFDNRLNAIIGGRGIGKTTFLLDYVAKNHADNDALYVSADNLFF